MFYGTHFTKEDSVHKQIMATKRRLMEEEDLKPVEAIQQAVKRRKYLIQKATGMLDDDPLEKILPVPNLSDDEDKEHEKVKEPAPRLN